MKKNYNFKKAIYYSSCDLINYFKEKNLYCLPRIKEISLNFKKNDIQTNYLIKLNQGEFDSIDFETQSMLFYFFQFFRKPFFKLVSNNLGIEKNLFNVCFTNKIDIQELLPRLFLLNNSFQLDFFVFGKKHLNLIVSSSLKDKGYNQNVRLNSLFPLGFFEDSHIGEVSFNISLFNSIKLNKFKDLRFFSFIAT